MPSKMKSADANCDGVLIEKDSTGQETVVANPAESVNLDENCKTNRQLDGEREEGREGDFEDERNKAMRTGGGADQAVHKKETA
jgi:hypothetical protein